VSGRTVTSKVMAIIGAFEDGPPTLSLTEIAAFAQVPLSTAHRLVGELVEWGALRRDDSGRYRVGRRVWKIGQNAGRELRDSARRHLADLFALTAESCLLAIRDGEHALIIDRFHRGGRRSGDEPADRGPQAGDRLPLHVSAVGQVLLAFEPAWIRDAYLARLGRPESRRLAEELAAVRRRGYAAAVEGGTAGCSVAVPVLVDADHAVSAVGLVSPTANRTRLERHVGALQQAARRIEPEAGNWPSTPAMVAAFARP
jgi:DNA-binding IclR family transcriptional regulator